MATTGNYTRTGFAQLFIEAKRYLGLRMQQGVPVVDADINDFSDSVITQLRRVIEESMGDGSSNNGFLVQEASPNINDFELGGGGGTNDTAGRLFVSGLPGVLLTDTLYSSATELIHPQISAIDGGGLVITDDSANYTTNELVGRLLTPDINNPGTTFTISSNTANTITISSGDLNAASAVGNHYRVELSTPSGSNRTDEVYVDFFLDEIDTTEDSNLQHIIGSPASATDAAFRLGLRQLVKVREGAAAPSITFVDSVGRTHYYLKLAELARLDGDNTVTSGMITDSRPVTHKDNTSNPHSVTATQVGALFSVDGVDNAGGDVDFVAGPGMLITPNNIAKTVTFESTGGGGGLPDETFTCDAAVSVNDTVYVRSDSIIDRANATSSSTAPAIGFVQSKPTGTSCVVRSLGRLTGFSGLTPGAKVYLDTTDGGHTHIAPSVSGTVIQVLGVATTTSEIRVQVSLNEIDNQ